MQLLDSRMRLVAARFEPVELQAKPPEAAHDPSKSALMRAKKEEEVVL